MKVLVKHFAALKQDADQRPMEVDLDTEAAVGDLLSKLGIEQDDIGILVVSGKQATFSQKLKDNDTVTLIPHIGGG